MSELVALLPVSAPYHAASAANSFGDKYFTASNNLSAAVMLALPVLREAVGDCPACVMAALRQAKKPVPMAEGFDFSAEINTIFTNVNQERFQCCAH